MGRAQGSDEKPALPRLSNALDVKILSPVPIILGLLSVVAHAREYWTPDRFSTDFGLDYVSTKALLAGQDPYQPMRHLVIQYLHVSPAYVARTIVPGASPHPPFMFLLHAPFALLPYRWAGISWLLVSAACVVGATFLFGRSREWSARTSGLIGVGALALPVIQKDLAFGQVNGELLLLLVIAWRSAVAEKEEASGLAIGIAAALKVFPIFLLGYFLFRRRLRIVLVGAVTFFVLTALGFALAGLHSVGEYIHKGSSFGLSYWGSAPTNIGWWGLARRWLSKNMWTPNAGVTVVGTMVAAFGAVFISVVAFRGHEGRDPFWWAVGAMLVAWPVVWDHYYVVALPWLFIMGESIVAQGNSLLEGLFAIAALGIVVGVPPGAPPLTTRVGVGSLVGLYQLPTYLLVLGLLVDAVVRRRITTAAPA